MFSRLNNLLKKPAQIFSTSKGRERKSECSKGQVAIVLLLIVAIALIFYAVVLNLSKLSHYKLRTTIASNKAAAHLASLMAGYGEYLLKNTFLEGKTKRCKWSSTFFVDFLVGLLFVGTGSGFFSFFSSAVGIGGFVGALADTVTGWYDSIAPGPTITRKWNEEQAKTMTPEDQYIEQGIMIGLQSAVDDSKKVCDMRDLDEDGALGYEGGKCKDYIDRYAVYYDLRMQRIKTQPFSEFNDFMDALVDFVYLTDCNDNDWGLYDFLNCDIIGSANPEYPCCYENAKPAYCDPCCVPLYDPEAKAELKALSPPIICPDPVTSPLRQECRAIMTRPEECPDDPGGTKCAGRSPFERYNPYIYSSLVQDKKNEGCNAGGTGTEPKRSFLEQLGKDDDTVYYSWNETLGRQEFKSGTYSSSMFNEFDLDDATGVFPALHKMWDFSIDLSVAQGHNFADRFECVWSDPSNNSCGMWPLPDGWRRYVDTGFNPQSFGLPGDPYNRLYNSTPFLDGEDRAGAGAGDPPLKIDNIGSPAELLVGENECADIAANKLWKKGSDQHCSYEPSATPRPSAAYVSATGVPYAGNCPKHGPFAGMAEIDDCGEGETQPRYWADDTLDEIIYSLEEFVIFAREFIGNISVSPPSTSGSSTFTFPAEELQRLANTWQSWYPELAAWVEKKNRAPSYLPEDGILWQLMEEIRIWRGVLDDWLTGNYAASTANDQWCYYMPLSRPPAGGRDPVSLMTRGEYDAISAGATSLDSALACLDYNINDPLPAGAKITTPTPDCPAAGATGNACKFLACLQDCNQANCTDLPRSLVPGFDPTYTNVTSADALLLESCLKVADLTKTPPGPIPLHSPPQGLTEKCLLAHWSTVQGPCERLPSGYGLPPFVDAGANATMRNNIFDIITCRNNYGESGDCTVGGVNVFPLNDPLLKFSLVDGSFCEFYGGSCCDWDVDDGRFYEWEEGNDFVDAILALAGPRSCMDFGPGNAFYDTLMTAMGTCALSAAGGTGGPFLESLTNAYVNIADPVNDAADRTQMYRCAQGCNILFTATHPATRCAFTGSATPSCSDCIGLPTHNSNGDAYNILPFYYDSSITADPNGPEINDIIAFYPCATGCGDTNCSSLPAVSSADGHSYELVSYDSNPMVDNDADRQLFVNCLYHGLPPDSGGTPPPWGCGHVNHTFMCSTLPTVNQAGEPYNLPAFVPPDTAARSRYDSCVACEGSDGDFCATTTPRDLHCGDPYLLKSKADKIICENAGDCCDDESKFASHVRDYDWGEELDAYIGDPNRFYNQVNHAWDLAKQGSSCSDTGPGGFMDNLAQSYMDAIPQVSEFEKRLEVLSGGASMDGLVDEVKRFKGYLDAAIPAIEEFLNKAETMIDALANRQDEEALSKQAIYAWKSDPPEGKTKGLWHIARVDVRVPRRCTDYNSPAVGTCGIDRDGNIGARDPKWPWIRTYTRRWGTQRCMTLAERVGGVKAKVTRWDEDAGSGRLLKFPGGLPLWKFRYSNTRQGTSTYSSYTNDELVALISDWDFCGQFYDPDLLYGTDAREAVMLDSRYDPVQSPHGATGDPSKCWMLLNEFLSRGVTSDTCAMYFPRSDHGSGSHSSYSMKFVPCDKAFQGR